MSCGICHLFDGLCGGCDGVTNGKGQSTLFGFLILGVGTDILRILNGDVFGNDCGVTIRGLQVTACLGVLVACNDVEVAIDTANGAACCGSAGDCGGVFLLTFAEIFNQISL
jgi:hypothetical protein